MSFGSTEPLPSFIKAQQERQVCEHSRDPLARILFESQRRVNRVKTTGRNDRLISPQKPRRGADDELVLDPGRLEHLLAAARENVAGVRLENQKQFTRQLGEMAAELIEYKSRVSGTQSDSKWLQNFYKVLCKMLHEALSHSQPEQLIKLSEALWQWYCGKKSHFNKLEEVEKKKEENARKTKNVNRDWGMMRQKNPDKFGQMIAPTWRQQYGPYREPSTCDNLQGKGYTVTPHVRPPTPPTPEPRKIAPAIGSPAPPARFSMGTTQKGVQSATSEPDAVREDRGTWLGMYSTRVLSTGKNTVAVQPMVKLPVRGVDTAVSSGVRDEEAAALPYQNKIYRRPVTSLGFVPTSDAISRKQATAGTRAQLGFAFYDPSPDAKETKMHRMYISTLESRLHTVQRRGLIT